jgi:hypothetical protein
MEDTRIRIIINLIVVKGRVEEENGAEQYW